MKKLLRKYFLYANFKELFSTNEILTRAEILHGIKKIPYYLISYVCQQLADYLNKED